MATSLAAIVLSAHAAPVAGAPAVNAQIADRTLLVSGSQAADEITLRLSALDPNRLEVDFGADFTADFAFDRTDFEAIVVRAGSGDDTVAIDQANGVFTTTEATRFEGENGDDSLTGGSGSEVFLGGSGIDFVDGNGGADTAFLGSGDDVFVWDPGDASDLVEGERGADTMVFNGAAAGELMAVLASAGRVRFTRNLGNIVMNLDGVETIDVNARGGTDTITVNDASGTDLAEVNVDLAGTVGSVAVAATNGDDTVTVAANAGAVEVEGLATFVRITNADPASDSLVVDTAAGSDEVFLDPALDGLIQVSVL